MIVWRGRGGLVAIIAFGCLVATELLTRWMFHDDNYYQQHGWPKLISLLVAAGLVWRLSYREGDEYTITNPEKRNPLLREQDTLFHISVKYWPGILCVLGLISYFIRS